MRICNARTKCYLLLIFTMLLFTLSACSKNSQTDLDDIDIIYTNDVHSFFDNEETDDEGNVNKGLTYASVKSYKNALEDKGAHVALVDAGDHSQGYVYGSISKGKDVIKLMNAAGYDLATVGNHEFDYGMDEFFERTNMADFPYISCNFYDVTTGETVFKPYKIMSLGNVKIGFIGISTPETLKKADATYFMDENKNYIYQFYSGEDGKELYDCVQCNIDEIRDKVDYVVAVGHMGVDEASKPYRSKDVIANTTGIDIFIDGHSHSTIECENVQDKAGNEVVLTQTGSHFDAFGHITISKGKISAKLITSYDKYDDELSKMTDDIVEKIENELGKKLASCEFNLISNDETTGDRIIRYSETNLGDMVADGVYYYFNEIYGQPCDAVIYNSGGIRTNVKAGDITGVTCKEVNPFGNKGCLVQMKGQQLLEALEYGASKLGVIDEETGKCSTFGGFLQVAGLSYEIDTKVNSSVKNDENGQYVIGSITNYRVKNVKIYNKEKHIYEPLDVERIYNVAGLDYILIKNNDGFSMLKDDVVLETCEIEESTIFSEYLISFANHKIATNNSPLSKYDGYLINYENITGAGRIKIIE